MTWRLRPNSPNTVRAIEVLRTAGKPLTCPEVAAVMGMSVAVARRHLSVARAEGRLALLGNGTVGGTAWATPDVAAVKRAELEATKRAKDEANRARRRALYRASAPEQQDVDLGMPVRVLRSTWEAPTAAPAATSVFHFGSGLVERRVCTYCLREGHLADACPRRERER